MFKEEVKYQNVKKKCPNLAVMHEMFSLVEILCFVEEKIGLVMCMLWKFL